MAHFKIVYFFGTMTIRSKLFMLDKHQAACVQCLMLIGAYQKRIFVILLQEQRHKIMCSYLTQMHALGDFLTQR